MGSYFSVPESKSKSNKSTALFTPTTGSTAAGASGTSSAKIRKNTVKGKLESQFDVENLTSAEKSQISRLTFLLSESKHFYAEYFEPLLTGTFEDDWVRNATFEDDTALLDDFKGLFIANQLKVTPNGSKLGAKLFGQFGAVHLAVQIGPWIFDWNGGKLIIPRPLRSNTILVALRVFETSCVTLSDVQLKEVSKFVEQCNAKKGYKNNHFNYDSSDDVNCHAVATALLKVLGVEIDKKWSEEVKKYLDSVRDDPNSSEMWITHPVSGARVVMKNRNDVNKIASQLEKKKMLKGELRDLLHGFDRACYMKREEIDLNKVEAVFGYPNPLLGTKIDREF